MNKEQREINGFKKSKSIIVNTKEELITILKANNLEVIDKRDKGGAIWIVSNKEVEEILNVLELKNIKIAFTANGGRASKRRPAWFIR